MTTSPEPPASPAGRQRLARAVQQLADGLSFSRAKRAVTEGQVLVDGEVQRDPGFWVEPPAKVEWDRQRRADRTPAWLKVELLHADDDVAVAAKPAGLLSMPTPEREKDTLLSRIALQVTKSRGHRPFLAVVHRLDRDTSGLVAFATSRRGETSLSAQLLDRSMSRIYDVIAAGELAGESGTFDQALIGDGLMRKRWVAHPGEAGKPSVTHWRLVERLAGATRLRVALESGRTHQIRIHLAAAGHPVLGDSLYFAGGGAAPLRPDLGRLALHAAELAFRHPADGRAMKFVTPLPGDLERLITSLRQS
ncbi:MAG: RluA family pseudouridine synthase [Thermoanaerobaculia bacterium]